MQYHVWVVYWPDGAVEDGYEDRAEAEAVAEKIGGRAVAEDKSEVGWGHVDE